VKQCHFEAANLAAMIAFIHQHNLANEVDLVTCETVDVYMSEFMWRKQLAAFKEVGGDVSKVRVHHGDDAKTVGLLDDWKDWADAE